jgi:hypothetical protein
MTLVYSREPQLGNIITRFVTLSTRNPYISCLTIPVLFSSVLGD